MARTKGSATFKDRLTPPEGLPKPVLEIFIKTVRAVDGEHFNAVDVPLIVEYARAVHQANEAAAHLETEGAVVDGKASAWVVVQEKSVRAIVALAMRLRISPQSRIDRTRAGTTSRVQPDMDGYYDPNDPDGLLAGNLPWPEGYKPKGLASFRRTRASDV